jgi:hypothetical protein
MPPHRLTCTADVCIPRRQQVVAPSQGLNLLLMYSCVCVIVRRRTCVARFRQPAERQALHNVQLHM